MKSLRPAVCIVMSALFALFTIAIKAEDQTNFDWLSLLSQPAPQQQQQQAPQGLLSYLLGEKTNDTEQTGTGFLNMLATLFEPKAKETPKADRPTVWDTLVNAWKESSAPPAEAATRQQESPIATALANLFKPATSDVESNGEHKPPTEQEKRTAFKKSQEMSTNFLKKLGLPVPEYTPEQEEQLFQQSNALYEQLNALFSGKAHVQ